MSGAAAWFLLYIEAAVLLVLASLAPVLRLRRSTRTTLHSATRQWTLGLMAVGLAALPLFAGLLEVLAA